MAKPAQQFRNQGQQHEQKTPNQVTSWEQQMMLVLRDLTYKRDEIVPLLGKGVTFDEFHSSIAIALRTKPDILDCYGPSIVNACIRAAYDGLKLDGKEAALSPDYNKKLRRNEARYTPMAFGIRKKILRSRAVDDVFVMLVWENEPFQIVGGVNRDIHHEVLSDTQRGKTLKAVYSVAVLKSGYRTFDYMWKADVMHVKASAQYDGVWNAHEPEMWKKTMLRRHSKVLPQDGDIVLRDAEAEDMFPQFQHAPHPQLSAAPPRPSRHSAIAAPETTFGYDLGGSNVIDNREPAQADRQQHQRDDRAQETRAGVSGREAGSDGAHTSPDRAEATGPHQSDADVELPEDDAAWTVWALELEADIAAAKTVEDVNAIWADERARLDASPDRERLTQILTDRVADLAAEAPAEATADDVQKQATEKTA